MKAICLVLVFLLLVVPAFASYSPESIVHTTTSLTEVPGSSVPIACPTVLSERVREIRVQETTSMDPSETQKDATESDNSDSSADSADDSVDNNDPSEGGDQRETQEGEADSPDSDSAAENGETANSENPDDGDSAEPLVGTRTNRRSTTPSTR
jgi:hypothetical protein